MFSPVFTRVSPNLSPASPASPAKNAFSQIEMHRTKYYLYHLCNLAPTGSGNKKKTLKSGGRQWSPLWSPSAKNARKPLYLYGGYVLVPRTKIAF